MKNKEVKIKSEYTEKELKMYYLLNCPNESCNWKGLSKDVLDIEEKEDSDEVLYLCPHCNSHLTIVK